MGHLLPQHEQMLRAGSAISLDVILERGYDSVTRQDKAYLLGLGFAEYQLPKDAGLLIPTWSPSREIVSHQLRLDTPRILSKPGKEPRTIKYESVPGHPPRLNVPPRVADHLGDPAVPLWITEGAKKADAIVSAGTACLSINGVWNWRGRNREGGTTVIADFEFIALRGREVLLVFDADARTNPSVNMALSRLAGLLRARGAKVLVADLGRLSHAQS